MKYRVMDDLGRPWFCDPDFFPVGRGDEGQRAQEKLPEIQKDADTFTAIVAHLALPSAPPYTADQQLSIYREWKTLNVLQLQPGSFGSPSTPQDWIFSYLAMRNTGGGERVEGRVTSDGRVTVTTRQQSGPPNCPICLARGTRIDTPNGPIAKPGLESINAALHPQDSPYWYYLHDKNGNIHYAVTNDEHNANKSHYLR